MHMAQNEFLPLRVLLQALFFEQTRDAMTDGHIMEVPGHNEALFPPDSLSTNKITPQQSRNLSVSKSRIKVAADDDSDDNSFKVKQSCFIPTKPQKTVLRLRVYGGREGKGAWGRFGVVCGKFEGGLMYTYKLGKEWCSCCKGYMEWVKVVEEDYDHIETSWTTNTAPKLALALFPLNSFDKFWFQEFYIGIGTERERCYIEFPYSFLESAVVMLMNSVHEVCIIRLIGTGGHYAFVVIGWCLTVVAARSVVRTGEKKRLVAANRVAYVGVYVERRCVMCPSAMSDKGQLWAVCCRRLELCVFGMGIEGGGGGGGGFQCMECFYAISVWLVAWFLNECAGLVWEYQLDVLRLVFGRRFKIGRVAVGVAGLLLASSLLTSYRFNPDCYTPRCSNKANSLADLSLASLNRCQFKTYVLCRYRCAIVNWAGSMNMSRIRVETVIIDRVGDDCYRRCAILTRDNMLSHYDHDPSSVVVEFPMLSGVLIIFLKVGLYDTLRRKTCAVLST
ncbi:BTB/POZ domain-containing protein [Tanacetum coccineum]|uniref:BTB/POZ domain-containing protein n=1 Tax=Tanacetum coccineum TaxID=301880 RepID=A0ABQ5BNU7_9ASTR